jgi:Coenzyme PQQ synthesis protein D (PqqD)
MILPEARSEGLIVEALPGGEVLVYDLASHRAHSLNRSAAFVWRQCDGRTSLSEAVARLHGEVGLPADEAVVRMALDRLGRAGLLNVLAADSAAHDHVRRREVVRRLALTGGLTLLLPVVMSIVAPTVAEAASCIAKHGRCTPAGVPCCLGCHCSGAGECAGTC